MKAKAFTGIMLAVALLALIPLIINAGTTGKIKGIVTDKETGQPIPGVSVLIVGTTLGAMTKPDGTFEITNVPPGKYTL
ncbi:MAG: carboxypeptidase-like regulatory domain-containing protein, partial [Candidatus Zixiibacteriota bacterium]